MKILDFYKKQVQNNKDKVAVISSDGIFTFAEIENYSNYVAQELELHNSKEIVPFYLTNNFYVLPVVIGILKTGRIPLPLIVNLNFEESINRISDINYNKIITDDLNVKDYIDKQRKIVLKLKRDIVSCVYEFNPIDSENSTCYILCTSGSTGIPKKVFINENSLVWILVSFFKLVKFDSNSKFLFSTPYTFDVSLTEIFSPVFTSGQLICVDNINTNLKNFGEIIKKNDITHLSLSPSFAELLIDINNGNSFKGLEAICLAGEVFPHILANKLTRYLKDGTRVFNFYGPTETTIYATYYELENKYYDVVPIGKPLEGVDIYILKDNSNNEQGELCIGGKGLTNGYLLDSLMNAKKFINIHNKIYYLSGDYVHYDYNNNLIFDGRRDDQVQINGIRVELDEINSIVNTVEKIEFAKSVYYQKKIYIFYKSKQELKYNILKKLPNYLNPIVVRVDKYLLNSNRKLDIKRMIDKFYKNNKNKLKEVNKNLLKLLQKYNVNNIMDLDSLDRVRFLLDIEDYYKFKILENDMYNLNSLEVLEDYIQQKAFQGDIRDTEQQSLENFYDNFQKLNIRYALYSYQSKSFENEEVLPNCTQLRLFKNKQFSLNYLDLSFEIIDSKTLIEFQKVIVDLAKKIDIFRVIVNIVEKKFKLNLINKDYYQPCVILGRDFLNNDDLVTIFKKYSKIPAVIIYISEKYSRARFYFLYHIIDSSSLIKLEKILFSIFNDNLNMNDIKNSSYKDFMLFKQRSNSKQNYIKYISHMPKPIHDLKLKKMVDKVWVIKFSNKYKNNKSIILNSLYTLFRFIIREKNLCKITGAISYNYRNFVRFNAENIIGDIHIKIPFYVDKGDNFEAFKNRFNNMISIYANGIDFRYVTIMDVKGEEERTLRDEWEKLNFSLNYMGELIEVDKIIKEIKKLNFDSNFINIFTNRDTTYCVINSNIFKEEHVINRKINKNIVSAILI